MRVQKIGLDYFPLDVDLEQDDKIALIQAKHSAEGFNVIIKMFMKVYSDKGYYYEWNEKTLLLFADRCRIDSPKVKEIIGDAIEWGIFDKEKYETFHILTSRRIQKTYLEATKRRKQTDLNHSFLLLRDDEISVLNNNVNIIEDNVNILSLNDDISTQSKVKESKEKKSKVKESNNGADVYIKLIPKFLMDLPDFEKSWIEWVNYRKQLKKTLTEISAKRQLEFLSKQSNPIKVIEQSIMNQWQGLFELKTGNYNGTNSKQNNAGNTGTSGDFTDPANSKYKYL